MLKSSVRIAALATVVTGTAMPTPTYAELGNAVAASIKQPAGGGGSH